MCCRISEEVKRGLEVQRKVKIRMAEVWKEYLYGQVTRVSRSPVTGSRRVSSKFHPSKPAAEEPPVARMTAATRLKRRTDVQSNLMRGLRTSANPEARRFR
jgi:hypothetical protein